MIKPTFPDEADRRRFLANMAFTRRTSSSCSRLNDDRLAGIEDIVEEDISEADVCGKKSAAVIMPHPEPGPRLHTKGIGNMGIGKWLSDKGHSTLARFLTCPHPSWFLIKLPKPLLMQCLQPCQEEISL